MQKTKTKTKKKNEEGRGNSKRMKKKIPSFASKNKWFIIS